jgi:transposase-like protein
MPIPSPPDPKATCPFCEHSGKVGHDREIVGGMAVTIFKCHNCNRTWRIPDEPSEPLSS